MLEDLHIGVDVYGADGRRLGTLQRIVIATAQQHLEGVVVEEGLIESGNALTPGGWDKPRGRLVPAAMITAASDRRLTLSCDEPSFHTLPLFEHEQAIPVPADEPVAQSSRFQLGELIRYISSAAGLGGAPYLPPEAVTFSEPTGDAEIADGTAVWRREPHEEVGEVERVLLDDATGRIAAVVMRRKGLRGQRVMLPAASIADIEDGVVHVTLTDADLDALESYTPAD